MRNRAMQILFAAVIVLVTFLATANAGSSERILFSFDGSNGSFPGASVIFDSAGNLYGATSDGGAYGYGTIFKLSRNADGTWSETILHDFNAIPDGAYPGSTLIWDNAGNLYGTASGFGPYGNNGSVFELSPGTSGSWSFKVLSGFHGYDGSDPVGSLTFDAQGNLYGTTWKGGIFSGVCLYGGCGTVFKLTKSSKGEWSASAIFKFNGINGSSPYSNVIFDAQGNLYGTSGGVWNPKGYRGTAFELIPGPNGEWTEKILCTFDDLVTAGVIFDKGGNLYGTTWDAGAHFLGSIFELTPNADDTWTETTLHSFNGKDGSWVYAGVVFDSKGNLWGTTSGYGSDLGSVYELTPNEKGQWTINVLQTFNGDQVDGGVTFDSEGNIYSTAALGGSTNCQNGCGMVFETTP
jgi:uncharacterized repeat protein (TIGR03803 family)